MDSTAGLLRILAGADTLLVRPLRAELGVAFAASRDTVTYGASGRGYGAANSTIVLSRGCRRGNGVRRSDSGARDGDRYATVAAGSSATVPKS